MWRSHFIIFLSIKIVGALATSADSVVVGTNGEVMSNRKRLVRNKEGQKDSIEILADGSIADTNSEMEDALRARREVTPGTPRVETSALLDHQAAVKANVRRLMMDKDNIIEVIKTGIEAIVKSVPLFLKKPDPDLIGALEIYRVDLWKIIEIVVPDDRMDDPAFIQGKKSWNEAFAAAKVLEEQIKEFRRTGSTQQLVVAIIDIVDVALKIAGETWPAVQETFDAVRDIITGIGEAWGEFEKGAWEMGVKIIWDSVKEAVDDLAPQEVKDTDAYQYVMAALQATIGDLHKHVFEFKRLIAEARVCYVRPDARRALVAENNGRPNVCEDGYEYDFMHTCFPGKFAGGPCIDHCGKAGYCMDYCGAGKACCRRGWGKDPCECEHAHGYVWSQAISGKPEDYWQCVTQGPCEEINGKCQNHGRSLLQMNESYSEGSLEATFEKKNRRRRKQQQKAPEVTCKPVARLLELDGKPAPVKLDELAGALIESKSNIEQAQALDRVMLGKGGGQSDYTEPAVGGMQAQCKTGTLINSKCYGDCPAGMVSKDEKSRWCKQDCALTGTHTYSGGLGVYCGIDPDAITTTYMEITTMFIQTAMSIVSLVSEIKDEGFKPENIQDITNIVVEMAKPLAKPICNLTNTAPALAEAAIMSREYDGAMKVFKHFDLNFDGKIDDYELGNSVTIFNRKVNIDASIMTEIDTDHDGALQFNEFVEWLREKKLFKVAEGTRITRDRAEV